MACFGELRGQRRDPGTAQFGQALTASSGTWTGSAATYGYQWQRCSTSVTACAPIAGATTAGYTVMTADEGSPLAVTVTATDSLGAATASSAATPLIP